MSVIIRRGLITALVFVTALAALHAQEQPVTVIRAGRLVDTRAGQVLTNQTIVIKGDTIEAVGAGLAAPAGATVIDVPGAFMLPGTDAGIFPHGWNARQFRYMVERGMTPMQAIQAATVNAADLLGWTEKVGSMESGKLAESSPWRPVRWATSPRSSMSGS